jgi:hypothetical protein
MNHIERALLWSAFRSSWIKAARKNDTGATACPLNMIQIEQALL